MSRKPSFPVYPKKKHRSGQCRISLQGKDYYLGPFGSPESHQKYDQLRAEWYTRQAAGLTATASPAAPATPSLTVAQVVARWETYAEQVYSARGGELEQFGMVLKPLIRLYGPLPAAAFDAKCLETLQLAMATGSWMTEEEKESRRKYRRPVGVCRNVVNRRTVRVKTLWKWIEKEGLVPRGSHHHLLTVGAIPAYLPGVRKTQKRPPATWEKVQAVLVYLQPKRTRRPLAAMLELQWWTGCRTGEVRIFRTVDIDMAGPVVDGCPIWLYRPATHKNDWREGAEDSPRVVPLGLECQRILRDWLLPDEPEAYLFRPRGKQTCYTEAGYAAAVDRAAAKAGVDLEPLDNRHAARMRISKVLGMEAARAVLGQKSVDITALYGSLDIQHAAEAARKLG